MAEASKYDNVECDYDGPEATNDAQEQVDFVKQKMDDPEIDGISVAVIDADLFAEAIKDYTGKPIITFDADAPQSDRLTYTGTDNSALGTSLGKVLDQVVPQGGTYAIMSAPPSKNLDLRVEGVRNLLESTKWVEWTGYSKVDGNTDTTVLDCEQDSALGVELIKNVGECCYSEVDAIIAVGGWPLFLGGTSLTDTLIKYDKMRLVSADVDKGNFELFSRGYLTAAIGQEPFNMGADSIKILKQIVENGGIYEGSGQDYGTHLQQLVRVPLILPELNFDYNYIGSLKVLGYVSIAIIMLFSIACIAWVFNNRTEKVVRASQPLFLYMICVGVMIFSCTIIPLGFDDGSYGQKAVNAACMATAWLGPIGFTIIFSALFSKLWRINKIYQSAQSFQRIKVTERDVLTPLVLLLVANLVVLITWTIVSPIEYTRKVNDGTDDWNRPISSYGTCFVDDSKPYVITLSVLNIFVLILANYQAFKARKIETEYSESKYIVAIMFSMLQACILGIPILILTANQPKVVYIVCVFIILIVSLATLSLLFIPKYNALQNHRKKQADRKARLGTTGNWRTKAESSDEGLRFKKPEKKKPMTSDKEISYRNLNPGGKPESQPESKVDSPEPLVSVDLATGEKV
jgi:gamma-aminobutyric acid type B receptor